MVIYFAGHGMIHRVGQREEGYSSLRTMPIQTTVMTSYASRRTSPAGSKRSMPGRSLFASTAVMRPSSSPRG